MIARVIRYDNMNADLRSASYELGYHKKFTEPLIIICKPEADTLSIHGSYPFFKYTNTERLVDFQLMRAHSYINSGVVFTDQNSVIVRIFAKSLDIPKIKTAFFDSTIEILKKEGLQVGKSTHRIEVNDLVFILEGKEKKFCGAIADLIGGYFSFFLTFSFNAEKANGLYKLESEKFKKRGSVTNISDVVGGLDETGKYLKETLVNDIIRNMSEKLEWELEESAFTDEENEIIQKLLPIISTDNWKINGVREK